MDSPKLKDNVPSNALEFAEKIVDGNILLMAKNALIVLKKRLEARGETHHDQDSNAFRVATALQELDEIDLIN